MTRNLVGDGRARTVRLERARAGPVASLRRLEYSPGGNTRLRRVAWGAAIGGAVGAIVGELGTVRILPGETWVKVELRPPER